MTCGGEVLPSAAFWPVSWHRVRQPFPFPVSADYQTSRAVLASADAFPPPPRANYPAPLQAPDTTATPTKQLFTPKHPEEEGSVLIMLQHGGRTSSPVSARELGTNPTLYKAYCTFFIFISPLLLLSSLSPLQC